MGILKKLRAVFENRHSSVVLGPRATAFATAVGRALGVEPEGDEETLRLSGEWEGHGVDVVCNTFVGEVTFSTDVPDDVGGLTLLRVAGQSDEGERVSMVSDRLGFRGDSEDLSRALELWNRLDEATRASVVTQAERDDGRLRIANGRAELRAESNVFFEEPVDRVAKGYLAAIVGVARSLVP